MLVYEPHKSELLGMKCHVQIQITITLNTAVLLFDYQVIVL